MSVNQMNEYKNLRLEIMDHERNAIIYSNLGTNNKGSGKPWDRIYWSIVLMGILFVKVPNPHHFQMENPIVWYDKGESMSGYCVFFVEDRGSVGGSVAFGPVSYMIAFLFFILVYKYNI